MTWHYQIIRHIAKDDSIYFGIHEVYLDEDKVVSYTQDAFDVAETSEELIESLKMMIKDAEQYPVIDEPNGE